MVELAKEQRGLPSCLISLGGNCEYGGGCPHEWVVMRSDSFAIGRHASVGDTAGGKGA